MASQIKKEGTVALVALKSWVERNETALEDDVGGLLAKVEAYTSDLRKKNSTLSVAVRESKRLSDSASSRLSDVLTELTAEKSRADKATAMYKQQRVYTKEANTAVAQANAAMEEDSIPDGPRDGSRMAIEHSSYKSIMRYVQKFLKNMPAPSYVVVNSKRVMVPMFDLPGMITDAGIRSQRRGAMTGNHAYTLIGMFVMAFALVGKNVGFLGLATEWEDDSESVQRYAKWGEKAVSEKAAEYGMHRDEFRDMFRHTGTSSGAERIREDMDV